MDKQINRKIRKSKSLLAITIRKFFNFLGFSGVLFIIYGVVSMDTGNTWPILEKWATPMSVFLTILGTLITALSIYFYKPFLYPPERFSKFISAPIVIVFCVIAEIYLITKGEIPPVIVNGFALLAISGGLFRIQDRTEE